jgi:hypothetical protein
MPPAEQGSTPNFSNAAVRELNLSILSDGWNTNPAEAERLELVLSGNPHDVATRTRLISYYYQQIINEPRNRHVLWLIENHPEAPIFDVASSVANMAPGWNKRTTDAEWERAIVLWRRQVERFPNHVGVLSNAAQALPFEDSFRLIGRLRALEPGRSEWVVSLARLYERAVRDAAYARNPGDGNRGFASSRKHRETRLLFMAGPDRAGSERMENELKTSNDVALVGTTGELLVEQVGLLGGSDSPEMVYCMSFGKRLLERARSLEPGNPRWRE